MRIALLGVAALAVTASAQGPAATLDVTQLRCGVDAHWGSIQTIRVSYSSSMPGPVVGDVVRDHAAVATLKGDKIHIDHTYGGSPAFEGRVFNRLYAFDGACSTEQDNTNGGAAIRLGRGNVNPNKAPGYFDLCMLTTAGGGYGADCPEASLVALLNEPGVQVRPSLEEVDGHWCHVVDLYGSPASALRMSVWIDTNRGFLPLRQVHWSLRTVGGVLYEHRIDEAVQLSTGHWAPVRGRASTGVMPGFAELSSPTLSVMEVERDAQGAYVIEVNQPVQDSLFALHEHVPPGFQVYDYDTREVWIASSGKHEPARRVFAMAIENPVLERCADPSVLATDQDPTGRNGGLAVSHAAAGLGGVLIVSIVGLAGIRRRIGM